MVSGVKVTVEGQARAIEALVGASKDATFAQKSAMRSARTKARSLAAKEMASRFGLPAKVFRKRIQAYIARARGRAETAGARLWMGTATPPGGAEHRKVQKWLLRNNLGARVTRRGDVVTGRGQTLQFLRIALDGAESVLLRAARQAMSETYIEKLRADYARRIAKRRR